MDWFENGWGLSLIVFLPLAGAAVVLLLPKAQERAAKFTALLFALAAFAASVYLAVGFDLGSSSQFQYGTDQPWISAIGSRFHIGVDGISLPLLVLSTLITLLCIVYSWNHWPEPHNPKAFLVLMLVLVIRPDGLFGQKRIERI